MVKRMSAGLVILSENGQLWCQKVQKLKYYILDATGLDVYGFRGRVLWKSYEFDTCYKKKMKVKIKAYSISKSQISSRAADMNREAKEI